MKIIKLNLRNPNDFLEELDLNVLNNITLDMDYIIYKSEDKEYYTEIEYIDLITILSEYLYVNCINDSLKNRNLKFKQLDKFMSLKNLYLSVISVEVEQYLAFNDVLNEDVFLRFNLNSFKKELEKIIKKLEFKLKMENDFKNLRKRIKDRNLLDLNNYKRVIMDLTADEGIVIRSTKKEEYLSILNIREKIGLNMNSDDYDDDWQLIINFIVYSILALDIKEIYIEENLLELMQVVINNFLIKDKKINIKVFN